MNLKNLTAEEKDNLDWLLNFIEDRTLRIEEIKKYYNSKKNIDVFVSLGDVAFLINGLFQGNKVIAEFRNDMERVKMPDQGKEILFKGSLTNLLKDK